jgi:hypothetical protein
MELGRDRITIWNALRYRALGFGITSASTPDAKGTMPMVPGTKRRHAFSFSLLVDRPGRAIMRREAVVILKTSEFDGPANSLRARERIFLRDCASQ